MPVGSFDADDRFIYRITKYHSFNPDNKWVNSYEAVAVTSGTEVELLALGTALVEFESGLHFDVVIFDRLLISTWEADSVPYDPTAFISSPLTAEGVKDLGDSELIGLSNCLDVRRFTASGRYGHIFYRGCLEESMVTAPSGKTVLSDRPAVQTDVDNLVTSSGIGEYLAGGHNALILAMINSDGTQVRQLTSLSVGQVSQVPLDHSWFNRTTP
jgi:hypothetical protein